MLVNEKAESFEWLFETFLKAMGGHKLVVIITNQDPDMKIAMKKVFTSVSPKFCIWHILKKLSEKLRASLNANTDFHSHFKSCVSNLESSKEFELTWKAIICDFKLEENGWLSQIYDMRSMWIPAYFKNKFLAE